MPGDSRGRLVARSDRIRVPYGCGSDSLFFRRISSIFPIYGEEGAVLLQDGSLIKTVLVVEDEIDLLALIAQILRRSGYHVLEASTPSEALFICENNEIDLMLSDFNLPEANGIILAQKVEKLRPNLPMIFMSGNRQAYDELTARGFICLRKPFSFADMEYTVRETLDARKSA